MLTAVVEQRLAATIESLDGFIAEERLAEFESLTPGRMSVNKRLDRFRHGVGLLGGRFEARNG
jgi:hypothetical protein